MEQSKPTQLTAAIIELSSLARASRDRVWQRELLELAAACSAYSKVPKPTDRDRIIAKATRLAAAATQLGETAAAAAAKAVVAAMNAAEPARAPQPAETAPLPSVAAPQPPSAPEPSAPAAIPHPPGGMAAAAVTAPLDRVMPATGSVTRPAQGGDTGKATEPLMAPHSTGTEPLVLIIDGDAESRQVLSTYFAAAGFRVAAFDDGGPALVQLREEKPALIVADLILPMMPGEVLILALRRSPVTSSIPILVVTAEPSRLGPEHEVDGVLTKPVNVSVVVEAARRLVSSSAGTDSLKASRA